MYPVRRPTVILAFWLSAACMITGCIGSRPAGPNPPFSGTLPPSLLMVAAVDPMFVHEVCKLPSVSDGLLAPEAEAVESLARLYLKHPEAFGRAFERMNLVGRFEVRAYCTPLQAVYWLVAEGREAEVAELIYRYSLDELLDRAWGLPSGLVLTGEQMEKAVEGLKNSEQAYRHVRFLMDRGRDTLAVRFLYTCFQDAPDAFDGGAWYLLAPKFEQYQEWHMDTRHRWADFGFTVERLNAPELVNYYQQLFFETVAGGVEAKQAEEVFAARKGDSRDFSLFATHCLTRAGYEAAQVPIERGTAGDVHWTTLYRDAGGWYLLDNAFDRDVIYGIEGPFVTREAGTAVYR